MEYSDVKRGKIRGTLTRLLLAVQRFGFVLLFVCLFLFIMDRLNKPEAPRPIKTNEKKKKKNSINQLEIKGSKKCSTVKARV